MSKPSATEPSGVDVSVIIPAYNRPEFLPASISSVLNQDGPAKIEIVCIDDGSTIDPFINLPKSMPENVQLLRKANAGVSAARRYGYERARGRYIAFNDDDDIWLAGKLRAKVELLDQNPEIDMVFGDLLAFTDEGDDPQSYYDPHRSTLHRLGERLTTSDLPVYRYAPGRLLGPFMSNMTVFFQTVLIRRTLIDKIGGIHPFLRSAAECTDFALRTAHFGRLAFLDQPTFRLRRGHTHEIARSDWLDRELKEFARIQLEYPADLKRLIAPWMGYRFANKGWQHFQRAQYREAAHAYRYAAKQGPIGLSSRVKWGLAMALGMIGGGPTGHQGGGHAPTG